MTLKRVILMSAVGLLGIWALTLFAITPASAGSLPPRPTPSPTPMPMVGHAARGAAIELTAPAAQPGWWTAVQWQDAQRGWHTVAGWQGGFDSIRAGVGSKTWWVADGDLGKGPFRWVITNGLGGALLAASPEFNLPAKASLKTVTSLTVK